MRIGGRFWLILAMGVSTISAALADDRAKHQTFYAMQRVLDDGRVVIRYRGGTYVGYAYSQPDTGEPVWHGRCAFHFKTGAVFEGSCAGGRFIRGFVRSVDGRTVRFLDAGRSDAEALRSATEESAL